MAYDAKKIYYRFDDHLSRLVLDYEASRQISPESENLYHGLPTAPYDEGLFVEHNVKRGLRNADGSGVVAGLTRISDVHGYNKVDGKVVPDQGKLTLRGYSIEDLVNNAQAENRYGYEEVAYLLITTPSPTPLHPSTKSTSPSPCSPVSPASPPSRIWPRSPSAAAPRFMYRTPHPVSPPPRPSCRCCAAAWHSPATKPCCST